jgi:hypothetical protein
MPAVLGVLAGSDLVRQVNDFFLTLVKLPN